MKRPAWKEKWYQIIFEADTPAGKAFDVILLFAIVLSVIIVMLDSVKNLHTQFGQIFLSIEFLLLTYIIVWQRS